LNLIKYCKKARKINLLEAEDIVHYIYTSESLPAPLKIEREVELVKAFQENNDLKAKAELIEHNLRLVMYIAKRFESKKLDIQDLVSVGSIGLIKAVDSYKLDKNIKLATYASRCIDNEILMYLRKNKKRNADVSLEESLSFDAEGNELHLEDILGTDPDLVTKELEDNDLKMTLMKEIDKLPNRDKEIMKLRYGLFGAKEITQKELAEKLSISQSYISRIEKKVIKKIKETIKL